ncbi:hypothetical protein VOLCADRAFT_107648 [Volvox carteri f. nagariensis]|uniref:Pherophorin domain-containing protein n=1 Tax=Volvox carteri f. nagariensis TaxID=3068 RepID=D8UFE3_VOLCA|nr:uncharacterized protein VOLCADRAFT_107648 [Volvox carteri f. nagariensis]EFJ41596.1 hypothetical protein VOLCADRAFT_107648 [Volvox carteri f. nagariensis]|eukprot:XP_002957387.1 hypothetical protein VOLCADRAFT_107648 [Volvox carteri f. nagariensis]
MQQKIKVANGGEHPGRRRGRGSPDDDVHGAANGQKRSPCANFHGPQFKRERVEILLNKTCSPEIRKINFDSQDMLYSWDTYDNTPELVSLKFTNLDQRLNGQSPVGKSLCWWVRPGRCANPEALCYQGKCQANIFSNDNKCCPATYVSIRGWACTMLLDSVHQGSRCMREMQGALLRYSLEVCSLLIIHIYRTAPHQSDPITV